MHIVTKINTQLTRKINANTVMRLLASAICLLLAFSVWSLPHCAPNKDAPFERAFCELKQSRYGKSLPTLDEFRRNPPGMQYLLIKRPAQRMGMELKKPAAGVVKKPAQDVAVVNRKESDKAADLAAESRVVAQEKTFDQCRYTIERINCAGKTFSRQGNKSNSALAENALEAGNTLQMGRPPLVDEQAWLAQAYTRYVRAMLSIGLAGSSFTYSGFAHTFNEHKASNTDFSIRFEQMFEFLKRDKKTLAVSRRRPKRAPAADECEWLDDDLLVCNSQSMNLVYLARDS
ncbi:MAG: hypothetical protein AB8B86_17915 [Pseudomonadales bacterium]